MSKQYPTTTIFGSGFIGSAVGDYLENAGRPFQIVSRNNWPPVGSNLGSVVFTSGMTSGFRENPIETAEVHVGYLVSAIKSFKFNSFVYLSSTRLYINEMEATEKCRISVDVTSPDSIFTTTKLTAESFLLSLSSEKICAVRVSNVYGKNDKSKNFLTSLISDYKKLKKIIIRNSRNSEKDYIYIDDVVRYIVKISDSNNRKNNLYNVASGKNVKNSEIAEIFRNEGCQVEFTNEKELISFPIISNQRLIKEFGYIEDNFSENLSKLIKQ
ncbi:MAG: NAD-dependent epimerase/dehydratase family protein [Hyphomicrobiales bacterium]